MTEHPHIHQIRRYLAAIEEEVPGDALQAFFTDDTIQRELPNRLVPDGATRDLAALTAAQERGRAAVTGQRYAIRNAVAAGDTVALELEWTARLKVPFGKLAAGDTMRAHFAFFVTFRDGKIASQRNYDCFDPF